MATEIELLQVYLLEDSDDQADYAYPCDYLSCACTKFRSSIYLTKYQLRPCLVHPKTKEFLRFSVILNF